MADEKAPVSGAFEVNAGQDLNLRPPGYEPGELPDCSTRVAGLHYSASLLFAGMRVGVVDLGTNSTRLLVADVDDGASTRSSRRTDDHAARRGRRRAAQAPAAARSRACATRSPSTAASWSSSGAERDARDRHQRRPRRGERRGLPRRDRVELRLRHPPAERRRGGGAHAPRRRRTAARWTTTRSCSTSAAARPS